MAQTEHRVGSRAWGHGSSQEAPSSVIRGIGDEAKSTGVIARKVTSEAVSVRRCVDIGGPLPSPAPPPLQPVAVPEPIIATPVAVQRIAMPEPNPAPPVAVQRLAVSEPSVAPSPSVQRAAPEPVLGRLIPMPCLVAGTKPSTPRREEADVPPSSATLVIEEAARSAPLAANEISTLLSFESQPFTPQPLESPPLESQVPSTIDPMAQTQPEIPFVSAQLVIMAPARRARPEPELPGVMVRPSLVLTPEQLAHDDTSALMMLTPPDVAGFCMPPRTSDPSAPTLPPLSTRTVPLSVLSARTMPVPVLEPIAATRKTSSRIIAALGLCVVLVFAFVAGLLVTTAVVVTIAPTSCR